MTKLQLNASEYSALELVYAKENLDIERKRADIRAQKANARATMGTGPLLDAELARLTELEAEQEKLTRARKEYAEISDAVTREKELNSMKLRLEVQQYSLHYDLQELELQSEASKMSAFKLAIAKEELALQRRLLDIAAQRENAKQTMNKGALLDQELKRLKELEEGERKLSEARGKYAALEEQRRQSFSYGWSQAFKNYQQDAEDYSRLGSDSFGIVIKGMSS
jgi:predicted RNase H-like nuclease (RuvC/YqgF family)